MWRIQLICCQTILYISGGLTNEVRDLAMSVAAMKDLVEMEEHFINELSTYGDDLKRKIDTIESFLTEVRSKKPVWEPNPEEYVGNPLNSFSLIRRLHEDWSYFELYMSERVGREQINAVETNVAKGPNEGDMNDALRALQRIQRYYDLDISHVSNGLLNGVQYDSQLTSIDCFAMGKSHREGNELYKASEWYKAAIQHFNETRDGELYEKIYNINAGDLYGEYVEMLTAQGRMQEALTVLSNVSDLNAKLWLQRRSIEDTIIITNHESKKQAKLDPTIIEKGCRGLYPVKTNLSCYYQTNTNPFLTLAPLKVELLNEDPYLALYHDVIYDSEIARMMTVHLKLLKRTDAHREDPLSGVNKLDRTVKFTWVNESENGTLNQRIVDMTGLDLGHNHDFQVRNFGIGGHVAVHKDNIKKDQQQVLGDRLASIIFYLNDVPQGGATIFPHMLTTIWPKKGNAVVWYNLDNAMDVKKRVSHESCPVLVGSKWTLNKWLDERSQIFSKPCYKVAHNSTKKLIKTM